MKKRVLPALVLSALAAFAAPQAPAAQFSNVVVFGDSLSDAGYFRAFLRGLGLPEAVVASMGRYTTNPGPAWSELVAQFYGVNPGPSNAGGTIYAQGGARVTLTPGVSTPPGQAERPVSTQIGEFLARSGGAADPNALYAIWAGANDVFANLGAFSAGAITQAQLQTNVLAAATAEIQQTARLRAAGARHIMVVALPDIGATPAFLGTATAGSVTALAAGYNTTLFTGLAGAGLRVIPVDAFTLFAEVRANPGAFGLTNVNGVACGPFPPITTTPAALFCNPSNTVPGGADSYAFADGVHPTSAGHRIVAQLATNMIEGPSQHALMAEAALSAREGQHRAIAEGVTSARHAQPKGWNVFVAFDGAEFDVDDGMGFTGLNSRANSATLGVYVRATDSVTLGAAWGRSRNTASFGRDAGGFRAEEDVWSLFGTMRWGGFYGTAIFSIADIDFADINRKVTLGTGVRTAQANAEGSNGAAHVALGYDFPIGRFVIGPTVSATFQDVEVNGFDEAGAGVAGLRMHSQKRKSEIWSGGVRASMKLGRWTPWLRVTADKERRDDERLVSATPLSMAAIGSTYDIPAWRPDNTFTTTAVGVHGWVAERVSLSVAAYMVSGREGVDQSGANAMLSVRF